MSVSIFCEFQLKNKGKVHTTARLYNLDNVNSLVFTCNSIDKITFNTIIPLFLKRFDLKQFY